MIIGRGSENEPLSEIQVQELCSDAFALKILDGKKILVIIPDTTRSGPMDMMFRIVYGLIACRAKALDFLVATGTHTPMNQEAIYRHLGITKDEHISTYWKARFFSHNALDTGHLKHLTTFSEDDIAEISCGLLKKEVKVTINAMIFDYDVLLIIGPTFPHETMGFSGGHKYFFPGICGEEIINTFHWIGALVTCPNSVGIKNTPMRRLIDRAAEFIPKEHLCVNLVVKKRDIYGLYIGPPKETFSAAADLSDKIHIVYKDHPFRRVLSCPSPMYDEIWTGGKGMVKLESVVEDGGELILYSPHITHLSTTYGHLLEEIGYHVRDYFIKQWDKFKGYNTNVLAQSCNVRGVGTYENGMEKSRINVKLATQLSEELCSKINFEYCNYRTINIEEWKDREDEGILYVPNAGETLYRLKNKSGHGQVMSI